MKYIIKHKMLKYAQYINWAIVGFTRIAVNFKFANFKLT